jgi:hypothetical protein
MIIILSKIERLVADETCEMTIVMIVGLVMIVDHLPTTIEIIIACVPEKWVMVDMIIGIIQMIGKINIEEFAVNNLTVHHFLDLWIY